MVCDTVTYMNKALQNETSNIVVEGANALMLDIDFGKLKHIISGVIVRTKKIPFCHASVQL